LDLPYASKATVCQGLSLVPFHYLKSSVEVGTQPIREHYARNYRENNGEHYRHSPFV
jgi:hypothetical protein